MIGLFWIVEEHQQSCILALTVPLEEAIPYGDMLTIDAGHYDYWTELAGYGIGKLRGAGLPTAPIWSDYDEWPRGRVAYDQVGYQYIIRADRQLHRVAFVKLIADRFALGSGSFRMYTDDHYCSERLVRPPRQ